MCVCVCVGLSTNLKSPVSPPLTPRDAATSYPIYLGAQEDTQFVSMSVLLVFTQLEMGPPNPQLALQLRPLPPAAWWWFPGNRDLQKCGETLWLEIDP